MSNESSLEKEKVHKNRVTMKFSFDLMREQPHAEASFFFYQLVKIKGIVSSSMQYVRHVPHG